MNRPYAVAGADIQPGMRIQLAPNEAPFVVSNVTPYPQANSWLHVFNERGRAIPVQKNAWYADLTEFSTQGKEVSSDDATARVGVVGPMSGAPAGEGQPSGSLCSFCDEIDGHLADCVVVS